MPTTLFTHATLFRPDRAAPTARVERERTLVVESGRIVDVRDPSPDDAKRPESERRDVGGRLVTPGLVDAHNHPIFLGDRAREFGERAAGRSYLDIAREGGGIAATVRPTRAGSDEELARRLEARLARLLAQGITTLEAKTGYGLSAEDELRQLRLLAAARTSPRLRPTLLAAHAIPPEVTTPEARADWVRAIAGELVPSVARERLAGRVDVFVEQGAYTHEEARTIAHSARAHGLSVHLHVDQLTAGRGAQLAAELGAQAVAHLERIDDEGIAALARAGTVAVLLPTATLAAREPSYAPARRLVESGVPIALATNLNPGTAPSESVSLAMFLAAVGMQLTPIEILWAFTRGGALALGEADAGLLEPGARADLVVWNATAPEHLPYHAAINHVAEVWCAGQRVLVRSPECDGVL